MMLIHIFQGYFVHFFVKSPGHRTEWMKLDKMDKIGPNQNPLILHLFDIDYCYVVHFLLKMKLFFKN